MCCSDSMADPLSPATAELGARVRAHRDELGLSQEALAARCGVHWTFIGQVERGQRNISLHNLLKVAAGLDVDPGELVAGLHPPESAERRGR
jgi:transcriptional regulator with XRE-family HTH domain